MEDYLNLYIAERLIEEIKLQAVREKRSVSQIVEQLIEGYLGGLKKNPNPNQTDLTTGEPSKKVDTSI